MKPNYTAICQQNGGWWLGWIEEIPGINAQERTREELLESLRFTLSEALEFNRQEALKLAEADYEELVWGSCPRPPTPIVR